MKVMNKRWTTMTWEETEAESLSYTVGAQLSVNSVINCNDH